MSQERIAAYHAVRALDTISVAVSSSVKDMDDFSFSAEDVAKAASAIMTAHTAAVVYTWSGEDPTATHGHVLPANATVTIQGNANIQALRVIRQSSDATVTITLEG